MFLYEISEHNYQQSSEKCSSISERCLDTHSPVSNKAHTIWEIPDLHSSNRLRLTV